MFSKMNLAKIAAVFALSFSSVQAMAEVFTFKVTAAGGKYSLDGDRTPVVNVAVGDTLVFDLSDASVGSHPFYITEQADSNRKFAGAVSAARQITVTVDASTPKTLFYSCTRHRGMGNAIQVVD